MKKKFLSAILCLCMLVGMVSAITPAAHAAGNPYPYWQTFTYNGQSYTTITCTYYAWQQVYDRHGIALPSWGNAGTWLDYARNAGYQTGTEARSGSLAVWRPSSSNGWGHVAYVTSAGGGSFTYNEGGTANRRANSLGIYEGHTQPDGYTDWPDGFIYLSRPEPTVTFSAWNNDRYTYVRETDAAIGQEIVVSNGNCTDAGMYLYDANGRQIASASNGSYNSAEPKVYFQINAECHYTLTPGTTYKYKFYAIVNGETYWGQEGSFKTIGPVTFKVTGSASPSNGGTVTGSGTYENGNTCSIDAAPSQGYKFVRWTENGSTVSTSSSYAFTVTASRELTAVFEKEQYEISAIASPSDGGTVSGNGTYQANAKATVTAAPQEGYVFKGWMENGSTVSTSSSYAFTVTASRELTAVFEKEQYEISAIASPSDGGTASGGGTYQANANAAVTAAPMEGYVFKGWMENGSTVSTSAGYSFTVNANRTLTAVFEKERVLSYTVTASTATGGTVSGGGTYQANANVTVTAKPQEGYVFKSWTENGSTVSTSASYTFTVSADRTLTAVFEKKGAVTVTAAEAEVNDTIEYANKILVNTEIAGSISRSSDVDWYVFQISNDGYISITFDHDFVDSSSIYWKTAFYTSDNKELNSWSWKGNTTSAETGSKIGVSAGTYYLRISDWSFSSDAYRFKVNYTPSAFWEKEFNETIVTANRISTGTEISGSIMNGSDVDWYQFELPEDGMISLTFDHDFVNNSSIYWKTAFYTSDNKELNSWSWKGDTTSAETGSQIGVSAGKYYLRISDWSSSSAAYRFKVNYTPSASWEKEFNETIVAANRISTGTEISGSIMNGSDVDWYQFELPEGGMISLTFDHDFVNSSSIYWKTAFYTSDNKELNSWSWKGNTTSAETGSQIGVSAGTYYLRISDWSSSSATYRFKVNFDLSNNPSSGEEQKPVAASGIVLNKASIALTRGNSSVLTAEVTPSNTTDKTIVWRSENTAVATVANGRVTAVGEGSTRITASCGSVTASCTVSVTAEGGQTRPNGVHFQRVNTYFQDQFTDVPANQWYTDNVSDAFEFGLMVGDSKTTFNPYGNVTIAEAVTMAARIHSVFVGDHEEFRQTGEWYQVYMDYAYRTGIISLAYYNCDVSQKASRAQFAEIFANSLPAEGLSVTNNVADGAIPDVGMENRYAEHIYKLYRAGILVGSDANGTFNPTTYITRAEAAAIVSRMAESDNRVPITLR